MLMRSGNSAAPAAPEVRWRTNSSRVRFRVINSPKKHMSRKATPEKDSWSTVSFGKSSNTQLDEGDAE